MLGFGDIAKIFEEIELRLIRSLKRNIGRHKQEVNKTLYDCAKTALKHRSGTVFEDMYWIDSEISNGQHRRTCYHIYRQNQKCY